MVNNMKKHKRRKNEKTSNFKYSVELTGLFLILIGIIGFGFGPVGSLLKKFSIFLVGTWWMFLLIGLGLVSFLFFSKIFILLALILSFRF